MEYGVPAVIATVAVLLLAIYVSVPVAVSMVIVTTAAICLVYCIVGLID